MAKCNRSNAIAARELRPDSPDRTISSPEAHFKSELSQRDGVLTFCFCALGILLSEPTKTGGEWLRFKNGMVTPTVPDNQNKAS